jgi:hypothetical protein
MEYWNVGKEEEGTGTRIKDGGLPHIPTFHYSSIPIIRLWLS